MKHFERLKLPENKAFLELFNQAEFLCCAIEDADIKSQKTACPDLQKALNYLNNALEEIRTHRG